VENNADKIRGLWTRITAETDPDKLAELVHELDVVLDEYEEKITMLLQDTRFYVDRVDAAEWARLILERSNREQAALVFASEDPERVFASTVRRLLHAHPGLCVVL
jgi:hypothetical protein